jgi:hypothetical protein
MGNEASAADPDSRCAGCILLAGAFECFDTSAARSPMLLFMNFVWWKLNKDGPKNRIPVPLPKNFAAHASDTHFVIAVRPKKTQIHEVPPASPAQSRMPRPMKNSSLALLSIPRAARSSDDGHFATHSVAKLQSRFIVRAAARAS